MQLNRAKRVSATRVALGIIATVVPGGWIIATVILILLAAYKRLKAKRQAHTHGGSQ